ncbi:MAG TPA: membrane protein insertion efficiency factor YidD [Terriglobales bacterium]|jgi:putative membrane protein insertion efficiency factor|nr:membrane protein insertion efficiency factor YidD [Terriglobales bacterium]
MKSLALWTLRSYKRWVSPMFPPSCRYVPTCSEYAIEAVEHYGAVRGGAMAAWRVLRCHPLATGGLDPVVKAGTGRGISQPLDGPLTTSNREQYPASLKLLMKK